MNFFVLEYYTSKDHDSDRENKRIGILEEEERTGV